MVNEAKRRAQDALYAAIENQAEHNMKAALSAPEKASLLRDLAAAYRLASGGPMPDGTSAQERSSESGGRPRKSSEASARQGGRAG